LAIFYTDLYAGHHGFKRIALGAAFLSSDLANVGFDKNSFPISVWCLMTALLSTALIFVCSGAPKKL
jgi:hypothetical protein